jgi:hypothetical protein
VDPRVSSEFDQPSEADRVERLLELAGKPDQAVHHQQHPERGERERRGGGEAADVALDPAQRAGESTEGEAGDQEGAGRA